MTPQEAINNIDDVLSSDVNYDESLDYELTSYDIDWLEKAKEALEKQIPKKIITEKRNKGMCPTCKRIVEALREVNGGRNFMLCVPNICPFCGQALDV